MLGLLVLGFIENNGTTLRRRVELAEHGLAVD
jgi:hypothetical protein